jgi:hypothetical protein
MKEEKARETEEKSDGGDYILQEKLIEKFPP